MYGDAGEIRRSVEEMGKGYVLAVSRKAYVWQGFQQMRVSEILNNLPEGGWSQLSAGAKKKGEKLYDWHSVPLNPTEKGFPRSLLIRGLSRPEKLRAYLCCCPEETELSALIRVAATRWTVERNFAESKGEVGLDHYEVRLYRGWYPYYAVYVRARSGFQSGTTGGAALQMYFPEKKKADSMDSFKKGRN